MSPLKNGDITGENSGEKTDAQMSSIPEKQYWAEALINSCTVIPPAPSIAKKPKSRDWCKQQKLPARDVKNIYINQPEQNFRKVLRKHLTYF